MLYRKFRWNPLYSKSKQACNDAHLAEWKIMRCIRSGAGVCGRRTLYFCIGFRCQKIISKKLTKCTNMFRKHLQRSRELTANYNHTSSARASLVVFVSSGFHSQRKPQIKVCFTYFVHFAILHFTKHLLPPELVWNGTMS